jgi:hypothetical protein
MRRVNRVWASGSFLTLLAAVSGCGASNPVPLSEGLRTLEADLQRARPITLSDLDEAVVAAWKASTFEPESPKDRLTHEIQIAQCGSHTANPLVPVVSGAFSLQLQGTFQWGASATGGTQAGPVVTGTGAFQIQKQQQVTVPITFVPVVNLGLFFMGQQMAYFANSGTAGTWPTPDVSSWSAPTVMPPNPPASTPVTGGNPSVGSVTPPPGPGSQLARMQDEMERVLKTRKEVEAITRKAIQDYPTLDCKDVATHVYLRPMIPSAM